MMNARGLPLGVLFAAVSCGAGSPAASVPVAHGTWGGTGISLRVTDTGAEVELDCAHGRADEALVLDADRRFDAPGTFVREQGGPERDGETLPSVPARYQGRVEERRMTLTIVLLDPRRELASYNLTFGSEPVLRKCL